jgi:hypothetical protein
MQAALQKRLRHSPVVLEQQARRVEDIQLRIADWIAKADHDFNEQELELKTNTQLTREIDRLTIELHERLLKKSARPGS